MRNAVVGNGHTLPNIKLNLPAEFEHSPRSAANLIHQFGYKLQNNRTIRRAAQSVDKAAHYVHDTSPQDMAAEIGRLVRRKPVTALIVAAVAGFLVGRSLSRR